MGPVYEALAGRAAALEPGGRGGAGRRPVLVGLAGAPGSGKSTAAAAVCQRLDGAVVLPMDGFHLWRSELEAMPDPKEAFRRRGAPWTFDAEGFVAAVRSLRSPGEEVLFPGFDHGVGDPVPGAVRVAAGTRVVLLEGNYLLLSDSPWGEIRDLLDEAWFLDCTEEEAMARVAGRHQSVGRSEQEAWARVEGNDRPNSQLVAASAPRADVLVPGSPPPPPGRGGQCLLREQRRAP